MTTITTINASDRITDSRSDINANFANLNSGKIETSVLDTDTTLAANSDSKIATQKAVKAYVDAGGNSNASTTKAGIVEQATATEISSRSTTGSSGAPLFVNPGDLGSIVKFGGTGADGALSISSGTTTIDLGSASIVTKNYTSISITGTGKLAFSNPASTGTIIILKSQGNVTLTSSTAPMIDASNCGAAGGTRKTTNGNGNAGTAGVAAFGAGAGSGGGGTGQNATGATAGAAPALANTVNTVGFYRSIFYAVGGGGGSGSCRSTGASFYGGAGGAGGGVLIIECAGTWNFTTSGGIKVGGTDGEAGSGSGVSTTIGGGGGSGGGGGTFIGLYNSLTANSGTVTIAGGSGGAGGQSNVGVNYETNGGSAGGGGAAGAGTAGTNGLTVSSTTANTAGVQGGTGFSIIVANSLFT